MQKEIKIKRDQNHHATWLRLSLRIESKLLFTQLTDASVQIAVDGKVLKSGNLAELADTSAHNLHVIEFDISNISFENIVVTFENLTQLQYNVIDAGIA